MKRQRVPDEVAGKFKCFHKVFPPKDLMNSIHRSSSSSVVTCIIAVKPLSFRTELKRGRGEKMKSYSVKINTHKKIISLNLK